MSGDGFDGLSGATAATPASAHPPTGIRTVPGASPSATRMVLVRHGEAVCNVSGVCGGPLGCTGLTDLGRDQVAALRDRLVASGELAGTSALYASVLPRAIETAEAIRSALVAPSTSDPGRAAPAITTDCRLCELHPGEADGLSWEEYTSSFGTLDWDACPEQPIAPGGESWSSFVARVDRALEAVASAHPGALVVVACHAGVIEASLLAKLPTAGGLEGARLGLRTAHASLTTWEVDGTHWRLLGYNDAAHLVDGLDGERRWWAPGREAAARESEAQQA